MQNTNISNINPINIIAIDGTTASGKGSLARRLAKELGYNYLNSGALYRLTAYMLKQKDFDFEKYNTLRKERDAEIAKHATLNENKKTPLTPLDSRGEKNISQNIFENENKITGENSHVDFEYIENPEYTNMENIVVDAGAALNPIFLEKQVIINDVDVWPIISTQEYGNYAARISPTLRLREALYIYQRNSIRSPGLVAEGRDMTSEVYTDALCKIYLDATPECRAERRLKEELLEDTGKSKTFEQVLSEIHDRDNKDKTRNHSPLIVVDDAYYLDTTSTDVEEALQKALRYFKGKLI